MNPWLYFKDLLDKLAAKPADVSLLLPDVWKKRPVPEGSSEPG